MIYIKNDSKNPYFNLSFEEYFFNYNFNDDCVILWQNKNTIVIGKNQNTWEELNHEFVKAQAINVVRRNTGGGAVYQDLGNVNYSFITKLESKSDVNNYLKFTKPIIEVLDDIDVKAEFSGRNDIEINGKKISGNAQLLKNNKILHHGTILFDVNLDILKQALKPDLLKIKSKGIKSIRSRVINIRSVLKEDMDANQFKNILENNFSKQSTIYTPTEEDIKNITNIMNKKYLTKEWNYGNNPKFNIHNKKRFPNGTLEVKINTQENKMINIKFYGDFLSVNDISEIENKMKNISFDKDSITKILNNEDTDLFFGKISIDQIIETIFN